MKLIRELWICARGLLLLARHVDQLPTDEQLRAAGIESHRNTGVPPWAFSGLEHHHRHL
jgi:hypothetical protein